MNLNGPETYQRIKSVFPSTYLFHINIQGKSDGGVACRSDARAWSEVPLSSDLCMSLTTFEIAPYGKCLHKKLAAERTPSAGDLAAARDQTTVH